MNLKLIKQLFLFFFVLVPLLLTAAFYLISGRFFDKEHYNPLTAEWQNYAPEASSDSVADRAEAVIALLNDGLTDGEEMELIAYFEGMRLANKMNAFLDYLAIKKFGDRTAFELLMLRFDEAIYQRPLSVSFLWQSTIAQLTGLIARPIKNSGLQNEHKFVDFLKTICMDSTLSAVHFEKVLDYNAQAWAWQSNRDSELYEFKEKYNAAELCLTERTLFMLLPDFFIQPEKVSAAVWQRIYALLEQPKCKKKGYFEGYQKERAMIKEILDKRGIVG